MFRAHADEGGEMTILLGRLKRYSPNCCIDWPFPEKFIAFPDFPGKLITNIL